MEKEKKKKQKEKEKRGFLPFKRQTVIQLFCQFLSQGVFAVLYHCI